MRPGSRWARDASGRICDSISDMPSLDGAALRAAGLEPVVDDRLAHATILVEIGELYDAEVEVTEVLSRRPDDVAALDLIAKIKHLRGELSEAIAYWGQVHARCPSKETAQLTLNSLLRTAQESVMGGSAEFFSLGPTHLWRKPAAYLELEEAFRLFVARQPDDARARCDRVTARYRGKDPDMFRLAVLAKAWIAELTGEAANARIVLEDLGRERGFESDPDRLSALARLYEREGTPDLLEKALNIWAFFERSAPQVSVLGHLASLNRRLGRRREADRWEAAFTQAEAERGGGVSELVPYWVFTHERGAFIDRYVPAIPLSRAIFPFSALIPPINGLALRSAQ